ncbi:putative pantothenate transporter [Talaromyces proteolyticus]|uniref:Pantothenate transporter n=1 Tax=Talaromyces proteolyticus TaxID=1131652 RepID=A0AAD4KPN7_9EURO|nr:putative pantothenate transporter [Talaromyces proteolyticus]KAH8693888.1 putative pantothenate transporter [Talaromyces proteolyticus]
MHGCLIRNGLMRLLIRIFSAVFPECCHSAVFPNFKMSSDEKKVASGSPGDINLPVEHGATTITSTAQDAKVPVQNGDYDDAANLFAAAGDNFFYTKDEARLVRWKLDIILLTMMTITYILSFIDKVALSEASIYGIRDDDHLVGQDYSWVSSIFYFGYLFAQYPSSVLMQKLPLGRYFGVMVILWGVATTCMTATNSFATLAVCRFFLGAFETCISPILTLLVGQYWTTREQPLRASIWWAGGGIGSFIADSITYAVAGDTLKGGGKYVTWQVIFLTVGPITIAWGILLFFALPTSPTTAWFLSDRERKIAVIRVMQNHTGIENRKYKLYQVREALKDPQAWMLTAMAFLQCIPGGGLTSFDKIVLEGLGYSNRQATLMSFPEDGIQLCSVLVAALPASHAHGRLGAFYVLFVNTIPYIMCMSLLSSNIGGFTKKATVGVMMFMAYSVGQIVAPHFFLSSESPRYPTGFRAFYVSVALMIAIEFLMIGYLHYMNRKKDRDAATGDGDGLEDAPGWNDLLDLTDKEHSRFRYVF